MQVALRAQLANCPVIPGALLVFSRKKLPLEHMHQLAATLPQHAPILVCLSSGRLFAEKECTAVGMVLPHLPAVFTTRAFTVPLEGLDEDNPFEALFGTTARPSDACGVLLFQKLSPFIEAVGLPALAAAAVPVWGGICDHLFVYTNGTLAGALTIGLAFRGALRVELGQFGEDDSPGSTPLAPVPAAVATIAVACKARYNKMDEQILAPALGSLMGISGGGEISSHGVGGPRYVFFTTVFGTLAIPAPPPAAP